MHNFNKLINYSIVFGFPEIEYTVYSQNFLRKVILEIEFLPTINFEEVESTLKDHLLPLFPRMSKATDANIFIKGNDSKKTLRSNRLFTFKSNNGKEEIEFSHNKCSIIIDGENYINIDTVLKTYSIINEFLTNVGLKNFTKVTLRKINIIEFEAEENSNANGILSYLLNSSAISDTLSLPGNEFVTNNFYNIKYKKELYSLNLKYGLYNSDHRESTRNQLVIDIELSHISQSEISALVNEITKINQEVFNAFNWLINERTINILRNE